VGSEIFMLSYLTGIEYYHFSLVFIRLFNTSTDLFVVRTKVLTTNWLLTDEFKAFSGFIEEISKDAHDGTFSNFDVGV
jgi:hypothetical protein